MAINDSVYIAAKFHARIRLRPIRDRLRALGFNVSSHWMEQEEESESSIDAARRDLREVRNAELLIIDTLDESNTGGREVELGHFLFKGGTIWRVGPIRNVFHHLMEPQHVFESWDEVFDAILADNVS